MIPVNKYRDIIKVLPILCVDVIVANQQNEYLLLKRANEPFKGKWWVVGGRVKKNEKIKQAAIRKIKEELSLNIKKLSFVGYYEGFYNKKAFNVASKLHTVSIVFLANIDEKQTQKVKLDSQSIKWMFSKILPLDFKFISSKGLVL